MSWRGVFTGVLGLIALEAVLRTDASATRFGNMFKAVGGLLESFMSPNVPAIPDLTGGRRGSPFGSQQQHEGGGGGGGGGSSW